MEDVTKLLTEVKKEDKKRAGRDKGRLEESLVCDGKVKKEVKQYALEICLW